MHRGYIYAKIPQLHSFYKYLYPEICRCPVFLHGNYYQTHTWRHTKYLVQAEQERQDSARTYSSEPSLHIDEDPIHHIHNQSRQNDRNDARYSLRVWHSLLRHNPSSRKNGLNGILWLHRRYRQYLPLHSWQNDI